MSMDLRLLRYFVAVAEAGTVTKAATALHVTQPVLSRQLQQLQQSLGLALFQRTGRRLRLTPAGEEFLPHARELLSRAEYLERSAANLAAGRLDGLHLAVPTTTLTDVLAPFLATLRPDDPVPYVRELDPRGALGAIEAGADLAIVTRPPSRALAARTLAVLPIWAYVLPDDSWARQSRIHVLDLVTRDLALLTEDFRPRALLDAAVEEAGARYGRVLECGNAQLAQAMAAAGRGIAVVSDDPRFDLVPLHVDGPTRPVRITLYAAWSPDHHASAALDRIAARLADFCAERYGPSVRPEAAD
jgi:DNA-binding transcriptional LysR family regulator